MRLLEPEQPPNKERCRWQNVPGKTGNKVICVKPSSDLEINFAYQAFLNFDWHKVLYSPSDWHVPETADLMLIAIAHDAQ